MIPSSYRKYMDACIEYVSTIYQADEEEALSYCKSLYSPILIEKKEPEKKQPLLKVCA